MRAAYEWLLLSSCLTDWQTVRSRSVLDIQAVSIKGNQRKSNEIKSGRFRSKSCQISDLFRYRTASNSSDFEYSARGASLLLCSLFGSIIKAIYCNFAQSFQLFALHAHRHRRALSISAHWATLLDRQTDFGRIAMMIVFLNVFE